MWSWYLTLRVLLPLDGIYTVIIRSFLGLVDISTAEKFGPKSILINLRPVFRFHIMAVPPKSLGGCTGGIGSISSTEWAI